jgi:CubicO group peptidase (beta-lactamase class C family)
VEAPACTSLAVLPEVQRALHAAEVQQLFTAVQSIGSVQGGIFHRQAAGTVRPPPPRQPIDQETFFDLHELTMPLATALAALFLVQAKRLDLNLPVATALPRFVEPHFSQITVDMLLDHSSGLPAQATLYSPDARLGRHSVWGSRGALEACQTSLRQVPLEAAPGTQACTSALGYQLLGWVLEKVVGQPLDKFLHKEIYGPLGLQGSLFFLQPQSKLAAPRRFVCSGTSAWRQKLLCGEVFDDNAWAQGGVAGHAGLFGTASGVWRLGQALLAAHGGEPGLFHPGTLKRFWTRSRRFATQRTLGWDTPTGVDSEAGGRGSRSAVGEVSRFGPSLWLDFQLQTVSVLLFNQQAGVDAAAARRLRARIYGLMAAQAAVGAPAADDADWNDLF